MRVPVCIRIEIKDLKKIDQKARKTGLTRAETLRAVIHDFAITDIHMTTYSDEVIQKEVTRQADKVLADLKQLKNKNEGGG